MDGILRDRLQDAVLLLIAAVVLFAPVVSSAATNLDENSGAMLSPAPVSQPSPQYVLPAQTSPSSSVTFKGRGNEATVIDKDGTTYQVDKKYLKIRNRANVVSKQPPAAAETQSAKEGQQAGQTAESAETTKDVKEDKELEAKKAEAEATKKADIDKLRDIQNYGGWFYDSAGKPISVEEVNARIEKGDVSGIKVIDIWQREYLTKSKPAEDEKKDAKAPVAGGATAATAAEAPATTQTQEQPVTPPAESAPETPSETSGMGMGLRRR